MQKIMSAVFRLIGVACAIEIHHIVGDFDTNLISLGEFLLRLILPLTLLIVDLEILSIRKENRNGKR